MVGTRSRPAQGCESATSIVARLLLIESVSKDVRRLKDVRRALFCFRFSRTDRNVGVSRCVSGNTHETATSIVAPLLRFGEHEANQTLVSERRADLLPICRPRKGRKS